MGVWWVQVAPIKWKFVDAPPACLFPTQLYCWTCTLKQTGIWAMETINFTEARNNLKAVLDRAIENADFTLIKRRDAEDAVVMSLDAFNSLMETVHLLRSPANAAHLARSIDQYRAGDVQERDIVGE
jgi:antitoxin YefM